MNTISNSSPVLDPGQAATLEYLKWRCRCWNSYEIVNLCPKRYRDVMRSAHWTSSPRGPPWNAFSAKWNPESLEMNPRYSRT
jgi:hypothetical protein